jgi:TonB family protein
VSRPQLVDRRRIPLYTEEARRAGAQGTQVLTLQIDEQGNVVGASFDRLLGHGLDERVLTFARTMHFTPAMRCNQPVASTYRIRLNFELQP